MCYFGLIPPSITHTTSVRRECRAMRITKKQTRHRKLHWGSTVSRFMKKKSIQCVFVSCLRLNHSLKSHQYSFICIVRWQCCVVAAPAAATYPSVQALKISVHIFVFVYSFCAMEFLFFSLLTSLSRSLTQFKVVCKTLIAQIVLCLLCVSSLSF